LTVLTKLDGDTRGGAAISIKTVVNKPIKFVGTGERWKHLMCFILFVWQNILGMGDVVSLVERAQEQFDEEEARRIQRKSPKTNLVLMISLPKFNR
jgi:signal recognition particle subunit SRP54